MIFCVVPEPLAPELYDQLAAYYEDDPNVTVIIDRRKSERRDQDTHRVAQALSSTAARASGAIVPTGQPAASARSAIGGAPAWRASSRPSPPTSKPE